MCHGKEAQKDISQNFGRQKIKAQSDCLDVLLLLNEEAQSHAWVGISFLTRLPMFSILEWFPIPALWPTDDKE